METVPPDAVTGQPEEGYPLRGEMHQTRTLVAEVFRPGFPIADLARFVEPDYFQYDPTGPDDCMPYVRTLDGKLTEVIPIEYVLRYAPGVYEVLDEKEFARRFKPGNRCSSTLIPPWDPSRGEKQRTYRCEGVANHRGKFHGGPAIEDPESRAGWQDESSTDHHPGEPVFLKVSEVAAAVNGLRDQRDKVIVAYHQYTDAVRAIAAVATAAGPDNAFGTAVLNLIGQIPTWARPVEPAPADDNTTTDTDAKE